MAPVVGIPELLYMLPTMRQANWPETVNAGARIGVMGRKFVLDDADAACSGLSTIAVQES